MVMELIRINHSYIEQNSKKNNHWNIKMVMGLIRITHHHLKETEDSIEKTV